MRIEYRGAVSELTGPPYRLEIASEENE